MDVAGCIGDAVTIVMDWKNAGVVGVAFFYQHVQRPQARLDD
jgi:hypothetical protein